MELRVLAEERWWFYDDVRWVHFQEGSGKLF
ncbi:hypothetical protein C5167_045661 [Papaver somniferum]|uniref:Uncharacterized protein n=1 Tax=Papaver somniferum TaxID=3469 RepID=A0A4Y7LBM2_PAPSO|nr:hypothetical protein C5167_045661 [Papaver somniferum]